MSTPEPDFPEPPLPPMPLPPAGMPGRVAAAIVGLQALAVAIAVGLALSAPQDKTLSATSQTMFAVFTLLFALCLGLVARGLWKGKIWPRTAAGVWLVLLLPVGLGIVQAERGLVGALILGSALVGLGAIAAESRSPAKS